MLKDAFKEKVAVGRKRQHNSGRGANGWQTGSALASASDYQSFNHPAGVYVNGSGNIYVADSGNNRICKWQ
jgi:DNA-binding beta-propeller fold protein YncE